ncbi:hypothetical protein Vadar_010985 [Vaccinium darrowii]|uniref:Uncharacterized protein n=1 Tax=Vaccinium darrowii TaxID=229202 RepID=A0ACB7ZBU1_9ERIC|nr:hypothetical protein Vadar_010985 [Vaccinium darrowii]
MRHPTWQANPVSHVDMQMPQFGYATLGFRILNSADRRSVRHFDILPIKALRFSDWAISGDHVRFSIRRRWCRPPLCRSSSDAGFGGLLNMQYMQLDLALLTALVERWRPETHTFHFTSAEATVALQDVEIITGLSVDGGPVTGSTDLNWEQMVLDLLGLELQNAPWRRGNKVTLQWLWGHFNGQVQETDTQVQIEQKAPGYIMQLIGSVLVLDELSSRVHLCYIELLRDLKAAGQYSWGSARLGSLYRGLCHLSESNIKDARGLFVLLQVWAWERLPYLAPGRVGDRPPRHGAALTRRWDEKFHSPDLATHVVGHYRHSLNMQKPDEGVICSHIFILKFVSNA